MAPTIFLNKYETGWHPSTQPVGAGSGDRRLIGTDHPLPSIWVGGRGAMSQPRHASQPACAGAIDRRLDRFHGLGDCVVFLAVFS